jgi:hypothetical protein
MSTTSPRGSRPSVEPRPAPALDRLEQAVQTLRLEWADGRRGRHVLKAQKLIASLGDAAATHDASTQITAIVQSLAAYRTMPDDARDTELRAIADRVKALEPHLLAAEPASLPKGRSTETAAPRPKTAGPPHRPRLAPWHRATRSRCSRALGRRWSRSSPSSRSEPSSTS